MEVTIEECKDKGKDKEVLGTCFASFFFGVGLARLKELFLHFQVLNCFLDF